MRVHMGSELLPAGEPTITQLTAVWFFAGMGADMPAVEGFVGERLAAELALVVRVLHSWHCYWRQLELLGLTLHHRLLQLKYVC